MTLIVLSRSTALPVSLAECKRHCRVIGTDDDQYMKSLIRAASDLIYARTSRALVSTSVRLVMDGFSDPRYAKGDAIEIPVAPTGNIGTWAYIDEGGVTQSIPSTGFRLVNSGNTEPALLTPPLGTSWPATYPCPGSVWINLYVGYASTAIMPDAARVAVYQLVSHWYENRETINVGNITTKLPLATESLITTLKWRPYV